MTHTATKFFVIWEQPLQPERHTGRENLKFLQSVRHVRNASEDKSILLVVVVSVSEASTSRGVRSNESGFGIEIPTRLVIVLHIPQRRGEKEDGRQVILEGLVRTKYLTTLAAFSFAPLFTMLEMLFRSRPESIYSSSRHERINETALYNSHSPPSPVD